MKLKNVIATSEGPDVRISATVAPGELRLAVDRTYALLAQERGIEADTIRAMRENVNAAVNAQDIDEYLRNNVPGFVVPFALDQLDLYPALEAQAGDLPEVVECKDYTVEVLVRPTPEFELVSYDPVSIECDEFAFDESGVDRQMDAIAKGIPDWTVRDKQQVGQKDCVLMALDARSGGQPIAYLCKDELMLQLGDYHMPYDFEREVVGMNVGETKSFSFDGPQVDEDNNQTTIPVEATVTVKAIMERHDATITDEWVKQHFPLFDDVGEFRKAIREEVELRQREEYDKRRNYLAAKALADRLQADIPDEYYEYVKDILKKKDEDEIESTGITLEQYFAKKENDAHEHNMIIAMQARELMKQQFALDAVYRHEGMELDERDVYAALHQMAPGHEEETRREYETQGRMYEIRQSAKRLKANRFVAEHAVLV